MQIFQFRQIFIWITSYLFNFIACQFQNHEFVKIFKMNLVHYFQGTPENFEALQICKCFLLSTNDESLRINFLIFGDCASFNVIIKRQKQILYSKCAV